MKTAARKKPAAPAIPSLELLQADSQETRDILERWRETIDAKLDEIPVGFVKRQYLAKGHGDCMCKALAEVLEQ
jgi:hypothetical protein